MAFGDIVQSAHTYVTVAGASKTVQFTNPTQHGNAIVILVLAGFSGLPSGAWTVSHANWPFTDRATDGAGNYNTVGRLLDSLNAMVGFGPVTLTAGSNWPVGTSFDMYEIDTPDGATFQSVSLPTYGEGYSGTFPFNHTNAVEFEREAFCIYAHAFSSNSAGFPAGQESNWSGVLGLPNIYRSNPTTTGNGQRVREVFYDVLDMALPQPMEQETLFTGAGASLEASSIMGQYVDGTTALSAFGATHYGGAGSYAYRSSQIATWGSASASAAVTKPAGTVNGDGVLLVALFDGNPGTITWPSGFTQLDADGFNAFLGGKQDDGFGTWYAIGDVDYGGSTVTNGFYWAFAMKEASGEGASYTVTRATTGHSGRLFAVTMAAMPAAAHVLSAETGGTARAPQGQTGSAGTDGETYVSQDVWCGGKRDDVQNRRFPRQKAMSSDYFVMLVSNSSIDLAAINHTEVPTPAADIQNQGAAIGYHVRIWDRGSDPNARVTIQTYDTSAVRNDSFLNVNGWAKAFVIGVPYSPAADAAALDVAPLTTTVRQLPFDLRDLRLLGDPE